MRPVLILLALAAGCTHVDSTAAEVSRPGEWQMKFQFLRDVDGPPYVVMEPAPDYPDRVIGLPGPPVTGCKAGCACTFAARDLCSGDVTTTCQAEADLQEDCESENTTLLCNTLRFSSNRHGDGVCSKYMYMKTSFGDPQLARYWVTLDRK